MGFTIHFYIIFGTNLLNGGPARIAVFCLFQCFEETEYQTESKQKNPFWNVIFFSDKTQETWTLLQEVPEAVTRVGGAPPTRHAPLPRGLLGAPPTYSFLLYIPTYPQTIRTGAKNLIPLSQLYVSTRSHLGACSGAPPERAVITEGFYIIIAPPMKCE